jgi:hypothetical protein
MTHAARARTEHLQGIAALLRYEEYYVKESAIQILCALGVDALLLFVDDILRYTHDTHTTHTRHTI